MYFIFVCLLILLVPDATNCRLFYDNISNITKEQLSPKCQQDLNRTTFSTIQLLIAFSSSIQLELGNYDKCLEIEEIETKFCQAQTVPFLKRTNNGAQKLRYTSKELHYCVFKFCSAQDLNIIFNGTVHFDDEKCSSKNSKRDLDAPAITAIVIFGIIALITIISTTYDIYLAYNKSDPLHSIAIAFSLYTNGKKLFHLDNSQELQCLNGIKAFSRFWAVLSDVYTSYTLVPVDNFVDYYKWLDSAYSQYANGATVSLDTLYIISAFLNVYNFQASMDKGVKFNVLSFCFKRYLRLTPALAAMVLAHAGLFNYFGSGPVWHKTDFDLVRDCRKYWWSALLYVQNYVNPNEICVPQSWYICIDMQLFLLSPVILLLLRRSPLWGYICLTFVSLLSVTDTFFVGWFYKLNGQLSGNGNGKKDDFMKYYYVPTHTRMVPYLSGIMLGHIIYRLKTSNRKLKININLVLLGWVLFMALMAACIYGGTTLQFTKYHRLANSFYISLMRPTWAVATCWVIFACMMGYGGPVDKFLSLPVFQIFSRICYSIYLVHHPFICLTNFNIKSSLHFSDFNAFQKFVADYVCSAGIAVVYTLVFESPTGVLEKLLLGG